jgi:hypothetical protein
MPRLLFEPRQAEEPGVLTRLPGSSKASNGEGLSLVGGDDRSHGLDREDLPCPLV